MFKKRLQLFQSLLIVNDCIILSICWLGAFYLRFKVPIIPVTKGTPSLQDYMVLLIFVLAIWEGTFHLIGVYRRFINRTEETMALFKANFTALMILVFITFFFPENRILPTRISIFRTFKLSLPFNERVFIKNYYIALQRRQFLPEQILIVGARELGQGVAATIRKHPELGLQISGFLTGVPQKVGTQVEGIKVLGLYEEIDQVIQNQGINLVIFALPLAAHQKLEELLNRIRDELVDIKIVPDLYRFISLRGGVEEFEGLPFINLRESPMVGWNRILKRSFDLGLASLVLILLSPLLLLIAVAIKLTSPGPILYRQVRMGLDGRVFEMLKFRSMVMGAENDTGPVWAQKEDPRRTALGRILRRFSLDELPQLVNVLKGEMSLVGPRPERPELIESFKDQIPNYMLRHKMKAGMTGWAQIHGWRGNTSLKKRIECDLYYIENWSLVMDLKILFKTLWKGIYSQEAC